MVVAVLSPSPAETVRKASKEDVPQLADAIARAFQDDPGWSHLLPDPTDRTERLRVFFETERSIRLGAEDYADEILSTLEVNLEKFLAAVRRGRDRLAGREEEPAEVG